MQLTKRSEAKSAFGNNGHGARGSPPGKKAAPDAGKQSGAANKQCKPPAYTSGNDAQARNGCDLLEVFLHAHTCISADTVALLSERGLFHFNGEAWRFGDRRNGCCRRLDGRCFEINERRVKATAETEGEAWHRLIGLTDVLENDRRFVLFVLESSKDALAAAELAHRCGYLHRVGILCALGSGYRPLPSEIEHLRGRQLRLICDNDAVSHSTAAIVCDALAQAEVEFKLWQWTDADEAVDLFAFLETLDASLSPRELRALLQKRFASTAKNAPPLNCYTQVPKVEQYPKLNTNALLSPSNCSTAQQLNRARTHVHAHAREGELLAIVDRFVVRQSKTGHRQAFLLARAIKPLNLSLSELSEVYRAWFQQSRAMLPKDDDQAKSFDKFLDQIRRVRFTDTGLASAIERARRAKLPAIPALAHNEEALRLAALCRELQRERGDGVFPCR
jgi:hypothetical protein